jgi:hypothetical protein
MAFLVNGLLTPRQYQLGLITTFEILCLNNNAATAVIILLGASAVDKRDKHGAHCSFEHILQSCVKIQCQILAKYQPRLSNGPSHHRSVETRHIANHFAYQGAHALLGSLQVISIFKGTPWSVRTLT